jgi:hypothetical protein
VCRECNDWHKEYPLFGIYRKFAAAGGDLPYSSGYVESWQRLVRIFLLPVQRHRWTTNTVRLDTAMKTTDKFVIYQQIKISTKTTK